MLRGQRRTTFHGDERRDLLGDKDELVNWSAPLPRPSSSPSSCPLGALVYYKRPGDAGDSKLEHKVELHLQVLNVEGGLSW